MYSSTHDELFMHVIKMPCVYKEYTYSSRRTVKRDERWNFKLW